MAEGSPFPERSTTAVPFLGNAKKGNSETQWIKAFTNTVPYLWQTGSYFYSLGSNKQYNQQ